MHCGWCTIGDALQVMHLRWGNSIDAPQVMHRRWYTAGDEIQVMHRRWYTAGDEIQVMHRRWCVACDALQVVQSRWYTAGYASQVMQRNGWQVTIVRPLKHPERPLAHLADLSSPIWSISSSSSSSTTTPAFPVKQFIRYCLCAKMCWWPISILDGCRLTPLVQIVQCWIKRKQRFTYRLFVYSGIFIQERPHIIKKFLYSV